MTPRQTARVKKSTALATRPAMTLSGQAQQLYDHLTDLKEEMREARERRQNALMGNARYATLKKQAGDIVKEATNIQRSFDVQHPKYKKDCEEIAVEAKAVAAGLAKIAVQALKSGTTLEVYHGRGPNKKLVNWKFSVQASLF